MFTVTRLLFALAAVLSSADLAGAKKLPGPERPFAPSAPRDFPWYSADTDQLLKPAEPRPAPEALSDAKTAADPRVVFSKVHAETRAARATTR